MILFFILITNISFATSPTTAPAAVGMDEDQTRTITDADFTFADIDGNALTGVKVVSLPSQGTLQNNLTNVTVNQVISIANLQGGVFKFFPDPNGNGEPYTTFQFSVIDAAAEESSSSTMTINVTPQNDPPTAQSKTLNPTEDTPLTILTADFGFNDIDGDAFAKIRVTQTVTLGVLKNGATTLANDAEVFLADLNAGNLTYTPALNGNGEDYASFTFRAYDPSEGSSDIKTITFDVASVNDLPTSADKIVSIPEDGTKIFAVGDFTFSDADGDGIGGIRVSSLSITGSLQLNSVDVTDGAVITTAQIPSLVFTPLPNGNGDNYASFRFEVSDGIAYSASAYLFTINVDEVDDPPTISPITDPAQISEDASEQLTTVAGITAGGGEAALDISAITVSSSNTALISNQTVSSYNSTTGEAEITYTPASDQYGTSTITVEVNDGNSTVSDNFLVTVVSVNDEPTINTVANQSTNEDTPITIDILGISAGALNEASQFLTITAQSDDTNIVPHGLVTYIQSNPSGSILFTPTLNAVGTAGITVTISDDGGVANLGDDQKTINFNLTINAVNDTPKLADITSPAAINEDAGPQSIGLSGIGDGDPELTQELTISATSDNTDLVDTFTPTYTPGATTATLAYTPKANAYGEADVEVTISDGEKWITKSFTIVVNPVNDAPTIDPVGAVAAIDEDAAQVTIDLSGITPGPNESTQTVTVSAKSSNSTIIPDPVASYNSGTSVWSIQYTPAPDQYGSVDITVTVTDDDANQKTATTTFTQVVNPINDPPTLNPLGTINIGEDAGVQHIVFDGITDDGTVPKNLNVTATSLNTDVVDNSNIIVNYSSPNASGSIDFQANPNKFGNNVVIRVSVTDKNGLITSQDLVVNIANVNDPPTMNDIPTPSAVPEDASSQSIIINGISPGPNETETLSANVSAIDESLFQDLSITLNGDGTATLDYWPTPNANGTTTVTVDLDDGLGSNSTISKDVNISILPVNDIPVFNIASAHAISENSGLQNVEAFATSISDGDPEDQSLSFQIAMGTPTENLTFVSAPAIDVSTGNLTYQATNNTNGQVDVNVTLMDNGGTANGGVNQITKAFTIFVTPVNVAPSFTLNGDPPAVNEDAGPITESAFAQNITDGDPELTQTMNFEITQASGSLTFASSPSIDVSTGALTYTANENVSGTATFNVLLKETVSGLASSSAEFTITINAVNDPPEGDNGSITVNEDATHTFQASNFVFSDNDGHNFEGVQITSLPLKGELKYNGSSVAVGASCPVITQLTFAPASAENGNAYATFQFKVRDESGDLSASPYTMTVNVTAISDDPTGASASVNTEENQNYTFSIGNFPFSDTDDDEFNGIIIQTNVTKGTLLDNTVAISTFPATVTDVTKLVYQPVSTESGTPYTNFTFDVIDATNANSASDTNSPYTMSINVGAVNDPPIGGDNTISMSEDQTYTFKVVDFPFSDPDDHTFAGIQITQIETSGTLKYDGADVEVLTNYPNVTKLTYIPLPNQNGAALANFKFRVIDSSSELNISTASPYTMTFDVAAVNDIPVFTITENPPAINEDAGAQTILEFASSIDDGDYELTQSLSFGLSYTLPSSLTFSTPPSINATTGGLTYTPAANAYGSVAINVSLNDGVDNSTVQQFTITVNSINDPPALDDITGTHTVNEDAAAFTVNLEGITAGPSNESQTITVEASTSDDQIIQTPSVVYTSPNTTGQLTITPVANASGEATITVTIKDGQTTNSSVSKTFIVTVNAVNDPPTLAAIAKPDAINEDAATQTINLEGITAGPNETQILTVTAVSDNQALMPDGDIEVVYTSPNAIGSIRYQPVANQSGTAKITVTVKDDGAPNQTITRQFDVDVLPVNDPPTLADLPALPIQINEDAGGQTLALSGISAGGSESQTLTITAVSDKPGVIPNPSVGTISGGEATLSYQPAANQFGLVTITVTVNDGQTQNNTIAKSFQVNVQSVNDVPTISAVVGSPFTIDEDVSTQNVTLQGISAGGGESQNLNIYATSSNELIIKNPSVAYIQGETTAILTYTPETNKSGQVSVSVYVNDLSGTNNLASTSFIVNVAEVNDPPTINDIISPGDLSEDASEQTVALSGITAGGGESQTVLVTAAEVVDKDIINTITVNYSGNNNATLRFTLQPNAFGNTSIVVTVNDQQSANNITTKSFNVNVTAVNDLPTLDIIASPYEISEDAGIQTIGLTGISPGPNESGQTILMTAISDNTALIPNPTFTDKTSTTKDLVFTPAANKNGEAKITVTVNDQQATNNTIIREFIVKVAPVNDAPVFDINPTVNILENAGPQSISNFAYNIDDGDPDLSQTLSFILNTTGALSFKTLPSISSSNGTLSFETSKDSNGEANVTVTLNDQGAPPKASVQKSFTINALAVNGEPSFTLNGNPPASTEDAGLVTEPGFAQNIDDGDPDLDQSADLDFVLNILSGDIVFATDPDINTSSGNLSYQAAPNSYGTSIISVTLTDGNKSSAPSYFTLTINPVNDGPVGTDEAVATNEDVPYTFKVADFAYSDVESNPFNGIQITTLETVGDLEYNGSDVILNQQCPDVTKLVYKPALNANGNGYATFAFKLRDSEGQLSDAYTMTINVTPVDDNPTSSAGEVNTSENTTYTFKESDFEFNDPDGDTFSAVRIFSVETKGDLKYQNADVTVGTIITNFNQFKFIPNPSENGNPYATFQFEVRDSKGAYSTENTMSIIVGPVNDRPTGSNESVTVLEDNIYTFSAGDFTFSDLDGHTFDGIRIETLETNGDLEYNDSDITGLQTPCPDVTLLTFQPNANANGTGYATFTFKVKDNSATFNLSDQDYTMTINVTSVNDAPVFTLTDTHISAEDAGNQTVPNFATSINSGDPGTSQVLHFNLPVLSTSTGNLTFTSAPSINDAGTLTYQATANAFGAATYSVTMYDDGGTANGGQNTSAPRNFTINVNSINDQPTISPIADVNIDEDAGEMVVNMTNITAGPMENQALTVSVTSGNTDLIPIPTVNYSSPATTGAIRFTPELNQSGQSTITVIINDGGSSNNIKQEIFLVTVNPVNDLPTINQVADQGPLIENSGEQIVNLGGITAGGGEDQALLLSVSSSNTALIPVPDLTYLGGTTAQLAYTPEANESGESTITVSVDDQNGEITQMSFKVIISPVNDPPTLDPITSPSAVNEDSGEQQITLTGITPGTNEDQELTITVESSNTDLLSSYAIDYTYPANSGTLSYTTNANQFGSSIVTVTVDDGSAIDSQVSEQFTVTVLPIADTPTVTDASTDQGNQTTSGLIIEKNENDGAEVTYFNITNIQNGVLYQQDGTTEIINGEFITYEQANLGLKFTPNSNLDGTFDIQASLEDAATGLGGGVITATIFINSIPTTTFPLDNLSIEEDSPSITFDLYQYFNDEEDPDMDLVFEVNNTAPEIADPQISGQTLTISFIENQSGTAFITVRCTDTKGAFVEHDLQLIVQPVNDPPVFESTPATNAEQDALYEYAIVTSDIEDNDRTITLAAGPSWILMEDNGDGTAMLSGSPSNDDLGDHDIEVRVTETLSGLFEDQFFTINVSNVNDTPRFVSNPPLEVAIGEKYEYQIEISDPDPNDSFTVIIDNTTLPSWLVFNTTTLTLEGFPSAGSAGVYENIKLIVWDEAGATSEQVFSITVITPNTAPTITGGYAETINEDESLTFSASSFKDRFQDTDGGDTLSFIIITELPMDGVLTVGGQEINANDTIYTNEINSMVFTPSEDFFGENFFLWKASDGKSVSINEGRVTVDILEVEDPPRITNMETTDILYNFGDFYVQITETAEVTEVDIHRIESATFAITNNYNQAQDSLSIDVFDGITSIWNDTTGVLTITGIKSDQIYQQIVRSLIYTNQKRFAPSIQTRTVEIVVFDGQFGSEPVRRNIDFEDTFVELFIPSGFTPDGSYPNDTWEIDNIQDHNDAIIRVYSREGNLVYESIGQYKEWDGTYKGNYVKPGVYYYTIEIRKFERKYSGSISVLR